MSIINNIPSALRSDGSYIEIGNTNARTSTNTSTNTQRVLLIGLAARSYPPTTPTTPTIKNILYKLESEEQAISIYGESINIDNQIVPMYRSFVMNNPNISEIYAIAPIFWGDSFDEFSFTEVLNAIAGEHFDYIVNTITVHLKVITDELAALWQPPGVMPGMLFVAGGTDYATAKTFGESLNSPHVTAIPLLDIHNGSGRPPLTAAYAGVVSRQLAIDPNVSLHGQEIILPAYVDLPTTELTFAQKNTLLQSGMSVYDIENGQMRINSAITGYTEDSSYFYVNTVALLKEIRRRQVAHYELQFANHLLAADGMAIAPGIAVVTPSIWKAELIKLYRDFEIRGLVQDVERYAESIICEINADNPNRLDYRDEPILAGQFRILAGQLQFN